MPLAATGFVRGVYYRPDSRAAIRAINEDIELSRGTALELA
jgi:hypothetical protein